MHAKTCLDTAEAIDNNFSKDIRNTLGWVAAAGVFAAGVGINKGVDSAIEFVSGYALEQSLSIDNLFVFLVLFDYFKVDREKQSKVLTYGILGAIILRAVFIGFGGIAIQNFHQVLAIFAAVLLYSSYKMLFMEDSDEDEVGNFICSMEFLNLSRIFQKIRSLSSIRKPSISPINLMETSEFTVPIHYFSDFYRFFTVENGRRLATPLLLCLVCVELSDIVFAFDSVPAIFGVTEDPFIVYTSNIFAISGLRSLFGVLSEGIDNLKYLDKVSPMGQ